MTDHEQPAAGVALELATRLRTAEIYDICGARDEIGILLIDAANELERLALKAPTDAVGAVSE